MASNENLSSITSKVYDLLLKLKDDERLRIINAALTLLGTNSEGIKSGIGPLSKPGITEQNDLNLIDNEQKYFGLKDPDTKIEELAVAARYLELKKKQNIHPKKDLQDVIINSRRNFDSKHYRRDIDNAKKSGLFTRGNNLTLTYYGQEYVDTLPDREAIKKLKKPSRKKRPTKKTSKK